MAEQKKTAASFSQIEMTITLKLTEVEAQALYNMTVYGHKAFTDWFYRNLGKHYLKPHEEGLISLFNTIKAELPQHFNKMEEIRKTVKK